MEKKHACPFDFQEFGSRELLESHLSKFHSRTQTVEKTLPITDVLVSSASYISLDDSPPDPVISGKQELSVLLKDIRLPSNPLSDLGELSENRLLKIMNSPSMSSLFEVIFN